MKTSNIIVSLLLLVITTLLGLILWGGQAYVSTQEKTNRDTQIMFQEYIKSSAIQDAACSENKGNIKGHETRIGDLETCDKEQNGLLIKHTTEIKHLQDYIN